MELNNEKTELVSKGDVNSISKNLNSAADTLMVLAILGICTYLYHFGLIKIQEGGIGSYEKYQINWDAVVYSLLILIGSVGLNYILRGISYIIRILHDIKSIKQ